MLARFHGEITAWPNRQSDASSFTNPFICFIYDFDRQICGGNFGTKCAYDDSFRQQDLGQRKKTDNLAMHTAVWQKIMSIGVRMLARTAFYRTLYRSSCYACQCYALTP